MLIGKITKYLYSTMPLSLYVYTQFTILAEVSIQLSKKTRFVPFVHNASLRNSKFELSPAINGQASIHAMTDGAEMGSLLLLEKGRPIQSRHNVLLFFSSIHFVLQIEIRRMVAVQLCAEVSLGLILMNFIVAIFNFLLKAVMCSDVADILSTIIGVTTASLTGSLFITGDWITVRIHANVFLGTLRASEAKLFYFI